MTGSKKRNRGEWAADLACVFLVMTLGNLLIDPPDGEIYKSFASIAWSFFIVTWMNVGLSQLQRVNWIRSYGVAGGLTWLFKDALAMTFWPVLRKWILNCRKPQS